MTVVRQVTVGVAVLPKKYNKHGFASAATTVLLQTRGMSHWRFVHLPTLQDVTADHLASLNVDILLHKISDFTPNADEQQRVDQELLQWGGTIVDAPVQTMVLGDRYQTCALLQCLISRLHQESPSITMEHAIRLPPTYPFAMEMVDKMKFPLIRKPIQAHGGVGAHDMILLHHPSQLQASHHDNQTNNHNSCAEDYILQEFIPHHGVVYKVYVIGDAISIQLRPSLQIPDNNCQEASLGGVPNSNSDDDSVSSESAAPSLPQPIAFSSQDFKHRGGPIDAATREAAYQRITPLMPTINTFSRAIQRELGDLCLFGWDLIVEEDKGTPYIIDVNYFPGYDDVDFMPLLLDALAAKLSR